MELETFTFTLDVDGNTQERHTPSENADDSMTSFYKSLPTTLHHCVRSDSTTTAI